MSFKTVSELKQSISSKVENLDMSTVPDLDNVIASSVRTVLAEVDIPETRGRYPVPLYRNITEYPLDADIYGTGFVDFRPLDSSRVYSDVVTKRRLSDFDRTKKCLINGYNLAFDFNLGEPILRVTAPRVLPGAVLDELDDSANWTAGGSASSLVEDEVDYYHYPASLRIQLAGVSTGTLTGTLDSQDLTDFEDVGVVFLALKVPSATNLSSLSIRLGSSASAYDEVPATESFMGEFEGDTWMIVAFYLSAAVRTGSPDYSAIDYARIAITHAAGIANVRVGRLFISTPVNHELLYSTDAIFRPSVGGVPSHEVAGDNDEILLNRSAYKLLEEQGAMDVAANMGGKDARAIVDAQDVKLYGSGNKIGLYARYRAENPSQLVKETGTYHRVRGFKKK